MITKSERVRGTLGTPIQSLCAALCPAADCPAAACLCVPAGITGFRPRLTFPCLGYLKCPRVPFQSAFRSTEAILDLIKTALFPGHSTLTFPLDSVADGPNTAFLSCMLPPPLTPGCSFPRLVLKGFVRGEFSMLEDLPMQVSSCCYNFPSKQTQQIPPHPIIVSRWPTLIAHRLFTLR